MFHLTWTTWSMLPYSTYSLGRSHRRQMHLALSDLSYTQPPISLAKRIENFQRQRLMRKVLEGESLYFLFFLEMTESFQGKHTRKYKGRTFPKNIINVILSNILENHRIFLYFKYQYIARNEKYYQ